jgi:hypothetical protein
VQEDHTDLVVTYLDATGAEPATTSLQTNRADVTGLLKHKAVANVPVGTRSARVVLTTTRQAGSYNDDYADSPSLVLTKL